MPSGIHGRRAFDCVRPLAGKTRSPTSFRPLDVLSVPRAALTPYSPFHATPDGGPWRGPHTASEKKSGEGWAWGLDGCVLCQRMLHS